MQYRYCVLLAVPAFLCSCALSPETGEPPTETAVEALVGNGGACTTGADCTSGLCYKSICYPLGGPSITPTSTCTMPPQATVYQESTASFGSDPAQWVDILRPAVGVPVLPQTLVFVHGGGFTSGSPTGADAKGPARNMLSLGYVAFSAGYRLAPAAHHPAQISDVRCAIRYAMAHAASYGADPTRIVLIGDSVGGDLEMMSVLPGGFDDGTCSLTGPVTVKAVIASSGLYDLNGTGGQVASAATSYLGYAPTSNPSGAAAASPLTYVNPLGPPLLLLHWNGDPVVPVAQASAMQAAALANGESSTLILTAGAYHAPGLFIWPTVGCTLMAMVAAH